MEEIGSPRERLTRIRAYASDLQRRGCSSHRLFELKREAWRIAGEIEKQKPPSRVEIGATA